MKAQNIRWLYSVVAAVLVSAAIIGTYALVMAYPNAGLAILGAMTFGSIVIIARYELFTD